MYKQVKGIEEIYYNVRENSYDEYCIFINGKRVNIPVVGNINPAQEINLCRILQDLIDRENADE